MWLCWLDGRAVGAAPCSATEDEGPGELGAKAESLRALTAAGLPVPAGFALGDRAFRAAVTTATAAPQLDELGHALGELAAAIEAAAPPPELEEAVRAAAMHLVDAGGALAVRSSISLEDRGAGAAAGVFSSRLAVAPQQVWSAIRAVWASVCTPLAAAYASHRARARGTDPTAALRVGVIVQRFVPGRRLTVYTRQPGHPRSELACVERGAELLTLPRHAPGEQTLARSSARAALELALAAERALELGDSGADVELVESDDGALALVQARPIVHPSFGARAPAPPIVTAALAADGRRWSADLAHNPEPLSPAQAGLIELVEAAAAGPWELRLCAGYLYSAPRREPAPAPLPWRDSAELAQRFAALEGRADEALGTATPDDLELTLAAYLRLYRLWACEMSPLVSAARRAVGEAWARPGTRPSAVEARLAACARGELTEAQLIRELGELSAAWDVAAPTLAEAPELLLAALARVRAQPAAAAASPARDERERAIELAAELAERDDRWFARAQARVREALRALGDKLGLDDEIFWIPLREARAAARGELLDTDSLRARASAARAAHRRASSWRMPPVIGGDSAPAQRWHGVGCGGAVTGRVRQVHELWRWASAAPTFGAGPAIIVVPAVTPALAVAVIGAAAIVSETGGLLDHGAAMARELGIPCVVGCAEALALPPGALVEVDGDAGVVRLLEGR